MNPIFNNKKCDLLRSVERSLRWQDVIEKMLALKLAYAQRKNRQTAKQLERRGVLWNALVFTNPDVTTVTAKNKCVPGRATG